MNIRTFWKSRVGTNLQRFTKSGETATEVILTNAPTAITEPGTAFSADRMNSIENRIENNRFNIDSLVYGSGFIERKISNIAPVYGITSTPSGDVYACVNNGDIYKQTGGAGDFIALGLVIRNWSGITSTPSGDVYASVISGDIYKQTGGTGDFIASGQTSRNWTGITSTPSGDVYACVSGGDLYKQTGGTGDFIALSQGTRLWTEIATSPSGDVYAAVYNGDIYKQTGGTGDFIALGQTSREWQGITATQSNDVYATIVSGDIYKQTGGTGDFIALGMSSESRRVIAQSPSGALLTATASGIHALTYNYCSKFDINIYVCRSSESGYTSGDYATINDALAYARKIQMECGKYIYVNVRDNHVINYQVIVENCDLSYVVIRRVGGGMDEFNVDPSGFTAIEGLYAFLNFSSCMSPVIGMLFNLQKATYSAKAYRGLQAYFSTIKGLSGAGFTNCNGIGISVSRASTLNWNGVVCTNSGSIGIVVGTSTANIPNAVLTGSVESSVAAFAASNVNAEGATATTTTSGFATFSCTASHMSIVNAITTGTSSTITFGVYNGGILSAKGTTGATIVTVNTVNAAGIIFR